MPTALDYMDYTEILEAAVCDRTDRVRSLQEEFLAHVQDTTWFERERAVNEHRYAQHMPWDDDDHYASCATQLSNLATSITSGNEHFRNASPG